MTLTVLLVLAGTIASINPTSQTVFNCTNALQPPFFSSKLLQQCQKAQVAENEKNMEMNHLLTLTLELEAIQNNL